jgi:hypothetical protein
MQVEEEALASGKPMDAHFLVNMQEETFFLGYLAGLFEEHAEEIGVENTVQICRANYKVAGRMVMEKYPKLYWTPSTAHCLDLMIEDIAKMVRSKDWIVRGKRVTTFIYRAFEASR